MNLRESKRQCNSFRGTPSTLLVALLLCVTAHASHTCTTCYIDYENGSDANDGTAKTTGGGHGPWKHAPGMLGLTPAGASTGDGCTGNCASQVGAPGDSYILKGGVVWPYTTLPWQPNMSGNATTSGTYGCAGTGCIYIGVDQTWNKGIVNAVTLQRDLGGCSPSTPPTVSFSGGGGANAAATAFVVPASAATLEPNIGGLITHISVTNQGSGYTSNPSVTVGGGGCSSVTAVADIHRAIIDMGSGSSIAWPVGTGAGVLVWGPGIALIGSYYIVDNLEIRNLLQTTRSSGIVTAFLLEQGGSGHNTYSNNYLHGRYQTCNNGSCGVNSSEEADRAIILLNPSDEATGNYYTEGDSLTSGGADPGCANGQVCVTSEHSINTFGGGTGGGNIHNNYGWMTAWWVHGGNNGSTPLLIHNNEVWGALFATNNTAHINEMYTISTSGSVYNYNNVMHSAVSGATNQQQVGNGTTQYFFNNVSWDLGGGSANYAIDPTNGSTGPGAYFFYNNTLLGENSATRVCLEQGANNPSGSGTGQTVTTVLQNNHCISTANPYFTTASGGVQQTQAGLTTNAAIQAASTVHSVDTATAQRYVRGNLFAPTSASNDTVTFAASSATANLTSLCSGNLVPLCSDINGVPRPATGGWQAGAFQLSGGPSVTNNPTSINFGNQQSGTSSAAQAVVVTNIGGSTVSSITCALTGTNANQFSITDPGNCAASLASSASFTLHVQFSPTAVQTDAANLTISFTGGSSSTTLSGVGTAAAPSLSNLPTSIAFGNQPDGTTSGSQNIVISNTGTAGATITSCTLTGANPTQFTITGGICPATLSNGP